MPFHADLHVHSKYSRATSKDCDLEHLAQGAMLKGITVVGTGDFTHPAWFAEIGEKLVPAEGGLFRLKPELEGEARRRVPPICRSPVRFMLQVEISTIYKRGEKTRKVHHLVYAAEMETAARFRDALDRIGNISSDGRPILGLDSRDLLEIALESGPDAYLVPAHVWTPWFSALGSKSGFDSVEECYGDLSAHIFAVETGLSSDPEMNRRVSSLDGYRLVSNSDAHSPPKLGREACVFDTGIDYFAMRRALEEGEGYLGTVEFFPEEGKYHLDGHRKCGVRLEPEETRERGGLCPKCGKPVTVGVMHRVSELADRAEGAVSGGSDRFRSLVPLPEIVSEIRGVGVNTKTVRREVAALQRGLGPELAILESLPVEEIDGRGAPLISEAIRRLRAGEVIRQAGYDGEYGVIRLFEPGELEERVGGPSLFEPESAGGTVASSPSAEPGGPRGAVASAPPGGGDGATSSPGTPTPSIPAAPEAAPSVDPNPPGILAGLDPDQRAAAEIAEGPLLIVAGPGTGKTRTLTRRIVHLVRSGRALPEECLALTFTRRARDEMRARFEELLGGAAARIAVTTFHGLGHSILAEHAQAAGIEPGFRVADAEESLEIAKEALGLPAREAKRWLKGGPGSKPPAYVRALRARGLVDFDDLLLLPVRLLENEPNLRHGYRARFRWISIDEYQDIDALQYRLVRSLAPAGANLCAIGDPDQSIYGFRGAEVGFFLLFQKDYPDARIVSLGRNYRSNEAIVEVALQAIAPTALAADRRLEPMLEAAPERVTIHEARSEKAEAEFVVHTIERLLGGTSHFSVDTGRVGYEDDGRGAFAFADFAVLYRTKEQAGALEEALGRSGIPFQRRSHELFEAENATGRELDRWDPRAERVSLMTLHAAKGLEFPVVFIVGCEDGLLPLRWGGSEGADPDEERRLLFVGITRARSRLFLSFARRRVVRGRLRESAPSPFLADVEETLLKRSRTRAAPPKRGKEDPGNRDQLGLF